MVRELPASFQCFCPSVGVARTFRKWKITLPTFRFDFPFKNRFSQPWFHGHDQRLTVDGRFQCCFFRGFSGGYLTSSIAAFRQRKFLWHFQSIFFLSLLETIGPQVRFNTIQHLMFFEPLQVGVLTPSLWIKQIHARMRASWAHMAWVSRTELARWWARLRVSGLCKRQKYFTAHRARCRCSQPCSRGNALGRSLLCTSKRGTYGTGLALVARLGWDWSPVMPRHFAWQAWHLAASTFVSRGRCSTWRHLPSFCLASVALMALALLWWRAWTGIGCRWCRGTLRGTWWHPAALCLAGVALETSTFVLRGSRGTLRGRRGTWRRPPSFHVAGVALGDIYLRFAWQAWHLWHTPSLTHPLSHTIFVTHHLCNTPSFTHHLSHTIFYTQLCHTPSLTPHLSHTHTPLCHTPLCLTPSFTTPSSTNHLSPHHLSYTTLSRTIFDTPSFTHHFVTHHLSHTTLSHALFHTELSPTPSFTTPSFTHHFVSHHLSPHHLSHITLSHTIFHHTIFRTQLCHTPPFATPPFTHHFATHHLSHTTLSHVLFHTFSFTHTIFHTQLCHTHTPCFFVTHHDWKKLPCGVIRSLNSGMEFHSQMVKFVNWSFSSLCLCPALLFICPYCRKFDF